MHAGIACPSISIDLNGSFQNLYVVTSMRAPPESRFVKS